MSGNGTIKFYVNNALVGSASFSGQIGKPEAEKSGTGSGSWGEPTVMAMGCNPKGNRADTGWRNGCFTAMNLYNLKIYNQTGCVASYEAKRNVGALKDLTGHNDGNVVAEDWTNEYIQLDGKDDWINLGSMSFRTNQVTLDLTMELVTLPSTYKTLMGNLEGGGVSLGLTEDYKPYMQINIGGSYDNAKATTALKKGQKVHLLGSYDGTTIRLFVDGQLVASKVHAGTLKPANGNTVMSIGSNPSGNSGGGEFTNMKVYSAHIYNKAYWDVSSNGDNSILAWDVNSNSSGAKKVYIASKGNIYANANASYMFSNIGAASICTATTALTNLNLLKTANTTNMYSMFWKTGYNAMTSLDLGTSFSTAKATNMEYMFQECGYKAMTSLNLRGINTSTATSMYAMFDGTGYTAMTSLNLGANFSTANVTKMTRMFKNCGYTKMTTLTLGSKFNTAKVTEMISMFEGTGYKVMTSLNLEGSFDTSKVTNMQAMFENCGYTAMTTLTLGSKFNTAKVTNMQEMFANTGYTKMTKLDLGDIFYTTAATNMTSMFNATGYTVMGELDLGPAFTRIAATYSNVFTNTGKSGCIIYAPEAIYQNKNAFKLNTSSGTTISYTRGSLNLRYKTEWIVESKNANTSAKNVTIQLRGRTNNNATSVYKSNVTSTLTKDNITVYINGAEASSISKSLGTVTTSKNPTTGYNDVLVTLTLSGFEQSALQSGKNYKEWSGDISIQIAQGTLKDSYGNKNTGLNSSGARVRESLAGPFADFIAPNVAYKFADSNIDKTNKRFTMVFDIVDKYYNASTSKTLAVTDLTIKIDGAVPDWNKVTRNLTSADLSNTVNGASKVVGKRYTLTLSNLQQSTIASGASYKDYSGVITVVVPEKKVYDTSGRYNPTTTITSGVNIPTNSGTGKVVDVVDPFWQVSNVNIDHSKNQVTMTIKGTDKYYSGNSLTKDKITVLVDGETATSVTKTLSSATSITKGVQYTLTLTTWQQSSKQSGKSYLEWSGNTVIRIAAGTLTDSNGNSSKQQDFSIGLVDFIKPTITKVSATKDAANKKETIVFDVDDKYINSTMISADNIKVYMNGVEATSITKSLSRTAKTGTVNKVSKTVGYKYTLVLTNFEQSTYQTNKEYKEWSGTVSIKIVANATKDTSNNGNVDTTITGDFVDFIKPQWRLVGSPTIDHTNNRVVMTIKGTDKYFKATTLATSNIKVYVDGTEATSVTKNLSAATDVKEGSTKVGVQYTLTLTGWEQSSKQNGKSYFEWSGNTVVTIAAGVLTDTSSNSSPETSFTIGQVDFIKPKIEKVSSGKSGGTETITFRVIDKYFNTSAKLTANDITVLVDSETASSVSKTLSNPTEIKETVNGASKVIGHQYTMTLTNFEKTRTTIDRNREYSDWSGTVAIKVAAGKVKDTSNNTNAETTITGDFLDVIKPNVTYQFSESNIDKNGKRFTMVFDITDKYYNASTSTTLSVNDLTIKIDGAVPDWNKVTRNLTVADYSNTVYYTSNGAIKHESKVIGKRYTLTLSNLQQSSIAANASYKDYSGVVTVAIPANKVADTTGNKNNAVTITSGVNIPTNSGTGKVVDVVDPYWQVSNVNINHSTNQVTMTIKGTDKYYKGSTLSRDNITVLVDGETATSVTKTLSSATSITNGVQYTLTLTTWQQSSKQSGKSYLEWSGNTVIRIAAGTMTDTNGNSSKQQDFSIGLVDFIKPTITKVSSTKDATNKRETIVFDVDDKYINTTSISTDNIKVYMNGVEATSITKNLSRTAKTGTVNGASKTIGYKYTLVLTNFEQSTYQTNKEYKEWSGTVSIKIVANATKDTSNNGNVDTTITGDFVDFIKPQWRLVGSPTIDHTNNRVVMTIKGTDKYFKATTLATSNIKVYVDGTEATSVTKNLSAATDVKEGSTKVGVQYTLTLTGWEQSSKQNGKSYFEWSGNTVVTIAAGVLTDTSSNSSPETSFTIGQVDFIKPKIEKVSSSKSGGTETITFRVIDKFFSTSAKLTKDDITVLVDSETASSVSKTLSDPTEIKETVNGTSKVIGHQYTMTLTNFEKSRTAIDRNREYSDWSGTVAIKIAAGKVKDTSNNTNAETTITGDFLDVIKPNVTYQFSESNIDKNGKRFTMVFDITDKYYNASTSTTLSVNDLTIKIDGAVPDWNKVTRNLTVADYSNTVYYTSNGAIKHESKVIGKRYTLTLSNLQQSSIAANASYKDYSGVVTVAIPANKVADTTGNKNNAVTITSGVNIPTNSGTGKVVDVVDPYWQVSNVNINHSTNQVTMTIKGTDKYYKGSTLSRDNITVLVDGETATSVTKTLSSATSITNGVQYTLTLTTWQQSSKQSGKSYLEWSGNTVIRIAAGTMTDTNGNSSKQQDFSIGLVDFIKPVIEKVSSTKGTNNETIVFDVNDKYISTKLSAANITTLINGEVADVTTTITSISDIKGTGKHSAKTVGHRYTVVISNFNKGRKNGRKYSDWSGTVSLRIAADAVQDTSQNKNNATTITGDFVDFIKPEFTYVYSSGNIDHTNKTLTVDFTVADRYFSTSTLTSNAANVTVKLIDKNINISGLTKTITKLSDYSDGSRGKVGENYRLTIGNIQRTTETDGLRDYSGPMSITFPANMVKDTSGNANDAKTITIGVNDPGTGSQQVVDVVSPVWSVASADVNTGIVKIRVKDKYLLKTGTANTALQLTTNEIAVLVNGTESTQVTKTITSGPTLVASGSNGYDTTYEYTIKIGNIAQTTKNYIEFTPKETVVGGKAKYRDENGGSITLRIKAGAVQDAFTNTNAQQDLYVGNVDNTGPEVYDIQKTIAANGDETFVFNITDKNYDSSKVVALNELNITIDGAQFSSAVQKNLTSQTLTDSATNKVLGHQYTLKLTNMKESTSSFASAVTATTNRRVYREYSGTIRIVINSNAARDLKGNTLNTATTTITSFNDKLAPEVVYIWSNSVINKNSKTFTMIFDITDKYYSSASLAIGDLTIKIGGKTPNWSSNEVGRSLSVSDIPGAAGKGKRYTLTLSNLQKLQIKSGDKYLDYSGVVTVAIPANKVKDTSGQGNVATTLTSGITIPGGTGSQEVVDVVEPYVQKMSSTVNAPAKTASITVRISDRYFNKSTLTKDTIKVYINGTENASVKTGWSTSEETESRTEKGTTSTVHVATNYTLNISGFDSNINQIKVVVPANVVKDTSENGNKQTEYIIYNVLRKQDDRDEDDTAPFLGNATVPRKDIDNVTFVSSTAGKNSTKWDVSAQGDSSILAWYTKNSNGTFKVYVGSDYEIFGNTDSSYLFRSVGVSENCTSTETITNIDLLNVSSVTNMRRMFELTGTKAMTKLDLGNNFNTINVTNMAAMFSGTGQKAMTTLNLGSNFNTSRVTNMRWMFNYTGRDKMTSLNLGNNFDTSNAQYMEYMFSNTGYYSMTTLNLGTKFNTSKVTDMSYMFYECGYNALTSLDLGSNFDTSSVTNMESMFCATGFSKLTNLDLGSKFNTIKVTNMLKMFYMTGHDTLTELDLGDKFNTSKVTNMAYMFTWIGRLKTLNLGDNFDTSNVTDMNGMFWGTGYYQMTNFSLGNKFNTKNVQDMSYMFYDFANNITSLDLGDQFYTTNATNMISMFFNCGATKMTSLDLGPAFTQIPSAQVKNWNNTETHEAYYQMFEGTGKTGSIVIHAPESIYQDKNNFKLNTSAATGTVNYTRGTIDPKYRTEWKKESATLNTTNKNIKITLRGTTNTAIAVDQYKSDVTSSLTKSNIKVYIDGVNATETLNKLNAISLGNATQTTENSRTGAKDVLQVVTLSNLEEAARQSGKSYKEWSGNIRLEIDQKTLTDTKYGNKNMAVTSTGARANHTFADGTVQNNTADKMFADFIKPEITYTYVDSDINHTNKTLTAEFILTDKYYKQGFTATNGKYDASSIIVGIDSYDKTALNKAITKTLTKVEDITDTVNGVANKKVGEKYRLVIGNLEQQGQDGIGDGYTYSGYMSLTFPEGTAVDYSGNKSPATTVSIGKNYQGGSDSNKKVVDVVDPVWEKGNINIETGVVKLRVKDKYLVKADSKFNLTKDKIKIIVNNKESTAIVKTLTGPVEIKANEEYEYTLTLSNISPTDAGYTEFTPKNPIVGGKAKYKNENGGNISLKIPAGAITDKYGNSTKEQIIDVGIFDGTGPAIYYVQKNRSIDANKETVIFNVTDKNYDSTDPITIDEMSVTIGGTTVDPKNLVITKAVEIITNVDGKTDVVVGHQYTLEILNIEETDQDFIKSGRKYRELSGDLKIQINEDAARDLKGNTIDTDTTTINDYSDIVRPEVFYKYATTDINYDDKTFTMVFDIVDKYYKEGARKKLTVDKLSIKIDGVEPDWTKVSRYFRAEDITDTVNGKSKKIGRRYTLTLDGLEQGKILAGGKYLDYSGVVTVVIPAGVMADDTDNENIATTISSGVSIPSGSIGKIGLPKNNTVMVMGANPTINTVSGGFSKMKAYSLKISDENGVISSYDATKNTGSSHSNSTTTWKDLTGSNNGTVNGATWGTDYLQFDGVDDWVNFGQINSQNQVTIEATISIDQISGEDDIAGNWERGGFGLYLINGIPKFSVYGKDMNKYVEISAPNVLAVRKKTTLKGVYDGVNMYLYVDDELVAQTSNSGTSAKVVDVVDPLVTKLSSTTNAPAKTATVKFKVTDKYFDSSTLTKDNIEVLVNGAVSNSVGKTLTSTNLTETRVENGKTSTVQYGIEYTLNITDFAADANQIKVRIPADKVKDKLVDGKQNGNKQTDIMVYNVLRKQDDKGEDDTAPFLGNATVPREDIDNVTFVSSTAGKNSTAWDVSAQGDSSILAWYTKNSNGTFKVYVGSDYEIFGNTDSSYLFRSVGLSDYCTSTETITNINLLNVSSVTNMLRMFELTGNQAMTKLDLGDNFNTSNVINMGAMFSGTGQKAMTTLNFGSNFNTLRVTNMNYMFNTTGRDKMTSLNLGSNFDTSNVTSMYSMFRGTGYGAMTTLNLGSKFKTSKVTDMSYMFHECGYTAMRSLNLGANFDTSKVTNMDSMFHSVGHTAMTSFNLGDKFNTSNVTNMNAMFAHMGWYKLTEFSLGDKFDTSKVTTMTWMFNGTGYDSMTNLNLGDKFDTSNVTNMCAMFANMGWKKLKEFSLGDKFNTSKVTSMQWMFGGTGYELMTSLDLGDQFYTTNVTNMMQMFENCGSSNMTSLDLGPAFTKIPSGTDENLEGQTHEVYYNMFSNTGKSGCTIYTSEQIYLDKNNFKLNASATTGTVNYTKGTINPKYRTEWKKEKVVLDQANDNIKITLRGTTNTSVAENEYISDVTSSLALNKIKVLIDGTDITSTVLNAQGIGNATQTTENSRTGAKDVLQTITLTNFAKAAKRLNGKKYKEWSGNITIEIAQGTLSEKYGNKNMLVATDGTRTVSTVKETNKVSKNTANTMFTDYIKPEFTYSSITDTNIVHGTGRKVEVMFDVTDKYFESTTLSNLNASQITIGMDDYDETELNKAITKKLEKVGTITDTVNGVSNVTVGERYKLTITGLEQQNEKGLSDGYTYSGYMSLKFAKGTIKDKSGNLSDATTITIGKNEPGGSDTDKTVVDIVDPVWSLGNIDVNSGAIKLRVKDKFLIKDKSKFELTTDKITIYADGVVSTEIEKQLSGPVEITANQEYEYTLTLLNIKPDKDEYEEFTPKNPIVGGTAKYKKENGGEITIEIAAGAVTDAYGNKTKEQIIDPGNIDGTGPEVYDIQKTKDATNNKETFVFNVTDKNYDSTDLVTIDELTVWLDGKQVDIDGEITKKFVGDPVEIITTVNGQERVVGHQYTLEIGSFVETNAEFVASNRKYRELSGTLEIKIATDAAKDKKGNKINPDTATITDFNDMIKPEVIYKYATSNIDKTNKIFKMEFDLVDKYCKTINNITVTDLTIQIDGKVPDWTKVTRNLEVSDIKEPVNGTNKLIGRHYTLTLSNLEQLQVKSGDNYLDYSGVITVAIPANKMQDTAGNQNVTTTITSGVSIPAGTGSDTIVDVVDPLIEKISSTVDAPTKTATLNFKVTDKYFASSDLAKGNIEILVNGAKNTTVAANNALTVVKNLTEPRTVDGKTVQVQYGIEYSLKISGFDANANQIKVRFPTKHVKDKSGNVNKQTDIMIYNVLRSAATETEVTNPFLGNTKVLRQNVDKVTFMSNIPDSVMDKSKNTFKNTNAWDVSAMQDKSIIAWYNSNEVKNGTYKVYIGSDTEIFGNTDSTNLFRNVGHSDKSTSTETITNISLLNTGSVTNMSWMFGFTGYNKMTKLELGNNFDTKNVTNMNCMFGETGCLAMTKLDLGTKFNTSKVTNMSYMFSSCGIKAMTTLNLGSNFDTSKVTNMQGMFGSTGYSAMTTLSLGSKFDTSNVTSMYRMFYQTGYKVMTSLDLGSKFNTSKVTDMSGMFERTGYTAMTTLNLGANFDTSKVTNMSNMFNSTGYAKMASLDLKAKFNTSKVTNMSGMFASTGHELMTTLDLGANFNTSAVTDMSSMFEATGYKKMTTLNLREKFNTSKVTNMSKMFKNVGFTAMTSLDLGNIFYTTAVTDTSEMFNNTGATAMTILDLGPAFDRIPDTNTDMFKNTGTAALVVYAPESIYSNVTTFIANRTRN